MKTFLKTHRDCIKPVVLALVLLGVLTTQSMQAAWTAPGVDPVSGTVVGPLTVSNESQTKNAELTVGASTVTGDVLVGGAARIGSSDVLPGSTVLGVTGKMGAGAYCNEDGSNCINGDDVVTGGTLDLSGVYTYNSKQNPQGISVSGELVCSCAAGDYLTGCNGTQGWHYNVSAISGQNACQSNDGPIGPIVTPICTCLSNR